MTEKGSREGSHHIHYSIYRRRINSDSRQITNLGVFHTGKSIGGDFEWWKNFLGGILGGFWKKFWKIKNLELAISIIMGGFFIRGTWKECFESFWNIFDRVLGVIPPHEVRGTKKQWYPSIQSRVENLFTGVYLQKSNRLCGYYSSTDYFLN